MGNILNDAIHLFYEEAAEHLTILENGLLRLEAEPDAVTSTVDELFRSAHTLKGSAALMKLSTISAVAHRLEDTFEELRDQQTTPSVQKVDAMLFALDQIKHLVQLRIDGREEPNGVLEKVQRLLDQPEQQDAAPPKPERSAPAKTTDATEDADSYAGQERRSVDRREEIAAIGSTAIKVGAEKLESMMNVLGQITVTKTHLVSQLRVMERMKEEVQFAGQRLLNEVANFSDRYAYALPEHVRYTDDIISEFQELEFDRYDEINLFTRKLQEVTNDINEALRTISDFFTRFTGEVGTMDRMIGEMKERISEARTIKAGNLFQRFTRSVRELSRETGKPLQLNVAGGETPIDRVVYDGLYDPLLHIIRNSVAHGFESVKERRAAGKPETGTIWLSAQRKGNTIDITIRDDGRGMQLDKIRQRGEDRGFIKPGQEISDQELIQLIFRPGFSTTESTDRTSGRGVGMNVVMDRLAALNGTIDIETEPGQGTTMCLHLPLSLVIINVIQFKLGHQAFVIPSNLIVEIVNLPIGDLHPKSLEARGQKIKTFDLNGMFGLPPGDVERRFAIVTQSSGELVALLVDEIVSQEDTVIKPFGQFLREMPHFSGTSLAGDGTMRLVVNPSRLQVMDDQAAIASMTSELGQINHQTTVLVVDDSLSVRKYAAMMLEAHQIKVLTATQGMEALDVLDENPVDFIITDLEMPVMHGYELLGELKRRGLLEVIPVAVLTSRAGDQHKKKAFDLGASDYLVKPFEEDTLMAMVRRHTKKAFA